MLNVDLSKLRANARRYRRDAQIDRCGDKYLLFLPDGKMHSFNSSVDLLQWLAQQRG